MAKTKKAKSALGSDKPKRNFARGDRALPIQLPEDNRSVEDMIGDEESPQLVPADRRNIAKKGQTFTFELLEGSHDHTDHETGVAKTYNKGARIKTPLRLDRMFANKFRLVGGKTTRAQYQQTVLDAGGEANLDPPLHVLRQQQEDAKEAEEQEPAVQEDLISRGVETRKPVKKETRNRLRYGEGEAELEIEEEAADEAEEEEEEEASEEEEPEEEEESSEEDEEETAEEEPEEEEEEEPPPRRRRKSKKSKRSR